MKYIIVKYISELVGQKISLNQAAHPDSYTAKMCGVVKEYFLELDEATAALRKMSAFNSTVDYGIATVGDVVKSGTAKRYRRMKFKIWHSKESRWVECSHRQARKYAQGGRMIGPMFNEVLFDHVSKNLTNEEIDRRIKLHREIGEYATELTHGL